MTPVVAIVRLVVQTVLYGNSMAQIERALVATCRAVEVARGRGLLGQAVIRFGDCGAEPALSDAGLARAEALCASIADFDYVHFGENLGHGGGHNRLLALEGRSTHVLVINPDAQLAADALAMLALRVEPGIGIVEARQVPLEHPKPYAESGDTSWASGACLLISSEAFVAAGGFDSASFFLHGDDVDLSWRVRLAGYRVVHEPRARVCHHKRLNPDGSLIASEAERFHSAVASVMLAHKFSRSDISRQALDQLRAAADPVLNAAAADVERRQNSGLMPEQIDPEHRVACFGPYYSPVAVQGS